MPAEASPELVRLIDELAPVNNRYRVSRDALTKIETMWDFGAILSKFMLEHGVKLDDLLFKIYDPYSTKKMSYITRNLGSYAYRINKYFRTREDIRKTLNGLTNYSVFREAFPLFSNPKYNLSEDRKREVLDLLTSQLPPQGLELKLRAIKQQIRPVANPRNQRANEYGVERDYLSGLQSKLNNFYSQYASYPPPTLITKMFGSPESRKTSVSILMALASEAFLKKLSDLDQKAIGEEMRRIYSIANGSLQRRSRFRRWGTGSNELLKIAEAIHSLNDEDDYRQYRTKLPK